MTDETKPPPANGVVPLEKVATGVRGLDEVLLGGIPHGRATLIAGSTGTGKTILGLEMLVHGTDHGEPGILITFEERADAIRANALAMGWDLNALEESNQLVIIHPDLPTQAITTGEFSISGLLAILNGHAKRIGARRLVVDALDVLLRVFETDIEQQNQLVLLNQWLLKRELTTVLTVKADDVADGLHRYLGYLVDCVIRLDQNITGQVTTRRLRVVKYRGSGFRSNQYPYVISERGVELIPVTNIELAQVPLGARLTSGDPALDTILGGGYRYASSVLISGSSGTGKTTLAATFARTVTDNGERVLYISFEESAEALFSTMLSVGIDLRAAMDAGSLRVMTAMPESIGAEEHLIRILAAVEAFHPKHIIVDAVSASVRFGSDKAAFDFQIRLAIKCKEIGVTCIYTNQVAPGAAQSTSGSSVSLVDTVLLLEQTWRGGEHVRRLLVLKSRGTRHSSRFHSFEITDDGIRVSETPYTPDQPAEQVR